MNLNIKYRPTEFSDVCSQSVIMKIFERQIETNTFKNCYLICGPSGCGKTTIARIFANKINKGLGSPIEIDAASNNSVDNVRELVEGAKERSLDSEYKIYIIDECHALSNQAWQAFLKCIEEPPKYTIFIFCTTESQKVPSTISNRCQSFKISKLSNDEIMHRLDFICNKEGYTFYIEALEYIAKMSEGSMRQAISYLDKCKDYSTEISLKNVIDCLGDYSYDVYFDLTNSLIDNNKQFTMLLIDKLYLNGNDLKLFISNYLKFLLQLTKYCIFETFDGVDIPIMYEEKLKYTIGIEDKVKYFNSLVDKVLGIKQAIKNDNDIKTTVEVMLLG